MISTETITLRCRNEEKKMIQEKANKAGVSLSQYVRNCALYAETQGGQKQNAARHIVEIQNGVTSLMKEQDEKIRKNRYGEVQEVIDELWKLLK